MHFAAAPLHARGKLLEVVIEVLHYLLLEFAGAVAQALPTGHCGDGLQAVRKKTERGGTVSFLKVGVGERFVAALVNLVAVNAGVGHSR